MRGSGAAGVDVVEVVLTWGGEGEGCVLATKYLRPGDRFTVGEADDCDALVPAFVIGQARAEIVRFDGSAATVVPPHGAQVWLDAFPAPAEPALLARDHVLDVAFGSFSLKARLVETESFATSFSPMEDASKYGGFALSALAHLSCLASLALFLPALGANDDAEISRDQILTMQHLLSASAEREEEAKEAENVGPQDALPDHGASGGGRARGSEGAMGTPKAVKTVGHWSAAGDNPRELQSLTRAEKQALVKDFGMLGLIATMNIDPNAPSVPWADALRGADRESHLGALFGPDANDALGLGGLGVSGAEEGGGGYVVGTGTNEVGDFSQSLDHRVGTGDPGGMGHGCAGCGIHGTHKVTGGLRMPREITTNGRLPSEVIQRIVRQNAGRFRACYASALRTNPSLEGRVEVRFMIDRGGQVSTAQDGASDLPNESVRSCIVRSFYDLSFPAPEGGTVTVVYPLALSPAD